MNTWTKITNEFSARQIGDGKFQIMRQAIDDNSGKSLPGMFFVWDIAASIEEAIRKVRSRRG